MKNRFLIIISIVFLLFSCDHFINLGDKSVADNDNTEGLPDEIYEGDTSDSASGGSYDDWNEDSADSEYDSDAVDGDTDYSEGDAPNTDSESDGDESYNDSDNEMPDDFLDEDGEAYVFPESGNPFPEGFSNVNCGCGNAPDYLPVCCDGLISVFNACFANCYAVNSGNKICSSYENGICGGGVVKVLTEGDGDTEESDEDEETDNDDTEMPDEDSELSEINNECGCYPEEEAGIFRCGEDFYAITECLANCICTAPERIFI